jgi:hypothetical protein
MSFHLLQLHKIEAMGGAPWQLHQELQARADQSAHGSPAEQQLGAFRALWLQDPDAAAEYARELFAARAEAAEAAARTSG